MTRIRRSFTAAQKAEASRQNAQIKQLREKLGAKDEVIAELMEENIRSKRKMGSPEGSLGTP